MTKAGGRARAEYERRLARDRAAARARRPYVVAVLALVGPITYAVSRAVLPTLFRDVLKSDSFSSGQAHQISLLVAMIAFLSLATEATRRRRSTHAFRIGAEGEERVGAVLDTLAARGYGVLHDVPLRGYGNIDHVAVGRGGVFTIETKNAVGTVKIRRGRLRENGRPRDEHVAQAHRQVQAVREKLRGDPELEGLAVVPLLCYARATIDVGWFGTCVIEGVHVVGPRGVKRFIERSTTSLSQELIDRVVAALSTTRVAPLSSVTMTPTPRAAMPRCTCGSEMVLRRRKTDGKPFYGCSRFPVCRGTQPAG